MPLTRTGSPVELIKNDAYKEYYTESKDFLNQHKHLLKCTSCRSNLFNSVKLGKIHIHPLLLVLICEKCYNFYTSGDFSQDEDGYDKYCRWCGNGGLLYICSKCPYGFCKQCYKKNFPNMVAEMEDDDWECVVCQNKPLYKLQALVKVLLKLSATSSSVKPARSSKRRRKLSSSSEESIKKDKKIFKPSSSKGKKIDKKKKKSSSLNDSSNSHSEKEIDENQIPECSDEEFKKKSKEFLLMNIKNLKTTLDLGLKECSKLAPKIEESDLEKTKDIFKYSQHLDKLVVTLKGNLENIIVNYGMKSLKLKFIKRSLKNKQIKSESTKSQSKKKNLGSDSSDDSNEDGDKKKTEITEYKSIKDKEVKMFDDDDSDDMFPKNKSTPSINFDSLLEKIDSEDEFHNIKKKKSDDESNNKMLNGAEKKEKTKKNNSSDSENSEEEKKKKKRKRSISSEGGKKEKREKKDDDDSDKGGNNDETHDQSEDKAEAEDNIKDKDIDNDNKKDEGKKKEKDEEMEDIQEKSKLESEEKKSKNVDKNRKSQIKQDKEKDVKKGKESNDEDDDNDNDKEEENKIEKETEVKKEESKLESEEEKTIKHLNKSRKSQRKDDKKDKKFVKNNEDDEDDENNDLIVDTNNEDGLEADDENDEVDESNKVDPDETVEMQELVERNLSALDSDSEIELMEKKSKRSVKKNEKSFNKGEKKIKKKEPLVNSSDSDTVFERLCNIKSLLKDKVKKIISDSDDEEEHNSSNNKNSKKQSFKTKRKILSSESEPENEPIFEDEPMSELFKDDSDLTLDGLESLEEKMKQQMLDFIEDNFDDDLKEELNQDIKSNSVKSKKPSQKTTESNKKPSWRDHKLLRGKISDTDSDNEFEKWEKHKSRPSDTEQRKLRKRRKKQRVQLISSDEEENEVTILSTSSSEQDQFESTKKSSDSEDNKKKTKVLKRIKVAANSNSSSSDIEEISQDETAENSQKKRKNIRKVLKDTETALSTKQAAKEEEERQKRIEERQKLFYELMDKTEVEFNENLILDIDPETKEPLVRVHPKIAIKLKPHQVKGVQFMFNSVIESIKEIEKGGKGNGCILAHCMGLGKTLQVVSMIHALLTTPRCQIRTVMVVCPLSTVHNWIQEFRMWTKPCKDKEIEIFDLSRDKKHYERNYRLKDWQSTGGVLIIGYNMLRTLANPKQRIKKAIKDTYMSCLIDPGADIVICDEGHLLKNEKSALSQTMTQIKTLRRIILTGTPLQNNLIEYHCMVSFVKPNLLGTRKEFQNRFVNPITNGQFADSNTHDMRVMKRRAHVLHKMLESSVQRYDYSVLTPFLPPKFEFAVLIKLSERQIKMYQHYLDYFATKPGSGVKSSLFADFQALQRISTHPHVLRLRQDRYDRDQARRLTESEDSAGSLNEFIDDSSNSHSTESSDEDNSSDDVASIHSDEKKKKRVQKTRNYKKQNPDCSDEDKENIAEPKKEWWENYIDNEEIMDDINESGKLVILFEILKECESIGDKVLIFSQSLFSLNLIEYFLEKIDQQSLDKKLIRGCTSTWIKGADYFRLDGSTQCEVRHEHCKHFNNPKNLRARLFLISTKAGGLGINLTAANRVIIFDASWNPSYDMQSIFRVYRFGQIKPCFIYRFLSQGTMEEKVYDRQVTKLSLSCRVVDEQQIERHFNMSDLAELYRFEPTIHVTKSHGPPKDKLLADLMIEFPQWILDYHEHDSLLENKQEEELNEEERKEAWQDYENEKKGKQDNFTQNNILFQTLFNQCLTRFIQQYPSKTFEEVKQMAMSVAASQVQLHVEQFQQKQLQYQQQLLLQQQQLGNFPTSNQNLTQQEINQRHQMQIQFQNQMKYAKLYNNRNFQGSSSHSPHPNQFKAGQSTPQQSDKLDQQSE